MGNSLKTEKEFFLLLKKHYSRKEIIKLDYTFIPNGISNKISRFYSNSTSIWFSRLKLNDSRIIYYFGSMENEKLGVKSKVFPRVIFYFDEKITNSSIRFYKDDFLVLIETQKPGEAYSALKNRQLKIMHGSKDKSLNRYYVSLGELNSKKLINNLDFFVKNFNFELDSKSVIISIPGLLNGETMDEDVVSKHNNITDNYLKHLKFNLKAIEIKNNIKKSKLSFSGEKKLISHIFKENVDGDYYFNKNFEDDFNKTDEKLLNKLNNCVINLKNESDYNVFIKKIVDAIKNDGEITSSGNFDNETPNSENGSFGGVSVGVDGDVDDGVSVGVDGDVDILDYESEFSTDLNSNLINEILLKINLSSAQFILKGNIYDDDSKEKLVSDLENFTSNMMFKFNTKTLTDEEREIIVQKIENDIVEDRIFGEIKTIVNYYVDQYKSSKNKFFALKYLKYYINSDSFKKLILEYNYDDNLVKKIINRVKMDIEKNNLVYSDVETKFEIYFRSYESNKKYYEELESYRKDIYAYKIRYNLTTDEITLLFDNIQSGIDNNNGTMDIKYIVEKGIENLVLNIKSDTCEYVNGLELSKLMDKLNLTDEGCEKLKRKVYDIIYRDNLRINRITCDYLLNLRNDMVNEGILNQEDIL